MSGAVPNQKMQRQPSLTNSSSKVVHIKSKTLEDPRVELNKLINITCEKIEELKQLLEEESRLTGIDVYEETLEPVLSRQDRIINRASRCVEAFQQKCSSNFWSQWNSSLGPKNELSKCKNFVGKTDICLGESRSGGSYGVPCNSFDSANQSNFCENDNKSSECVLPNTSKKQTTGFSNQKTEPADGLATFKDYLNSSALQTFDSKLSWYGSLDRNFVKKKKQNAMDKNRRHTKTVGSVARLDNDERCPELQPDEQYEIGLPFVGSSSKPHLKRSIFSVRNPWEEFPYVIQDPKQRQRVLNTSPYRNSSFSQNNDNFRFGGDVDHNLSTNSTMDESNCASDCTALSTVERLNRMTITKPMRSKNWFETNLDENALFAPFASYLSPRSVLGLTISSSSVDLTDEFNPSQIASPVATDMSEKSSKSSESSETKSSFTNESTKPFEMSDYYKYSTKYRKQTSTLFSQSPESNVVNNINDDASSNISPNDNQMNSADPNGNSPISMGPKLPPKQSRKNNPPGSNHPLIYKEIIYQAEPDPMEENLAWVMDTPTFV